MQIEKALLNHIKDGRAKCFALRGIAGAWHEGGFHFPAGASQPSNLNIVQWSCGFGRLMPHRTLTPENEITDKLRNAIQAGTGLPDVAQMEFNSLLSFRQLGARADIGPDVSAAKEKFIDWTWKSVSDGDKVYGAPWDSGPMPSTSTSPT
ncbi:MULTISPECIES: hypothetical protein [Rhizobium]|uniref:hypothetical protein n=1 Tax=Rhizobium TaxID=379 RepID=UPI00195A7366|nr:MULTISPECIES: hypothetical protein [Rhizobium]MBM7048997.1 hypothetical protein [Rhizobium lusitanum]